MVGEGDSIQPVGSDDLPSAIGLILWWASPTLVLFALQTWAGTLLTGLTLFLASTVSLANIYASTSSTAGIGLYTLPVVGWILAIGLAIAECGFLRWR